MRSFADKNGFTLIEVVVVVIIAGILSTIAIRSVFTISETARVEETKRELDELAYAVAGNPTLENNGVRSDFGYVGDVGSMPPNLDALISNPGGFSTWHGPYIKRRFEQIASDYKQDAWGAAYAYTGGVKISSSGSGSNIVRKIANNAADLTLNRVSGNIFDRDGTPPGKDYRDSITVNILVPNGSGGTAVKSTPPDAGGYFVFDSIPIGNHQLTAVYQPSHDTLNKFVSVIPNSSSYGIYYLSTDIWRETTGGGGSSAGALEYVNGSAQTYGGQCNNIQFSVTNTSGATIKVTSIQLDWSGPTAYFEKVRFDGEEVFEANGPRPGTGDPVPFDSPGTVNAGQTVTVQVTDFRANSSGGGGQRVDMNSVNMTITFSDGSVITFNTGECD